MRVQEISTALHLHEECVRQPIRRQPFNQWSLRKLTDCLAERQMVPRDSHVTIGRALDRHRVTYQRTRTWKESKDPDFAAAHYSMPTL
jgi:hypothetical protein